MAKQSIDTTMVASAVSSLRNANNNINRAFAIMKNITSKLEYDWNGAAGEKACTTMYNLFKGSDARYTVIQNYINLLEQQVNPNYISAEEVNSSLADKFK